VPPDVSNEVLFHLSRTIDLSKPVRPRDRFQLMFTETSRVPGLPIGMVLYMGLRQTDGELDCYVVRLSVSPHFGCASSNGETVATVETPSDGGMVIPVKGVLTSRFGNRFHPILKRQRLHAGVDWGAPRGTPVVAAFAGSIVRAGVAGGYGNLVEINHGDGIHTRYAHLHNFADGTTSGTKVDAGQLIGFVGTTGSSTGNHLHFEVRKNGTPVDPLNSGIKIASTP
jgi:murein DD-endopeptidase MepM/ murein hydrolase activator NlpD